MPHRLDHFHRNQFVVASAQVAVILEQHGDPVFQSLVHYPPCRRVVLLPRNCRRGHPATVVPGSVNREPAPAGTDLEQVITRLQVEFAADNIELVQRGFIQIGVRAGKYCRRVHHFRVEKQREEIVAEVVMARNVFACLFFRIAIEPVGKLVAQALDEWFFVIHLVQEIDINRHQAHDVDEVRCRPFAQHVGLGAPDRPAKGNIAVCTGIVHYDFCLDIDFIGRISKPV